MFPASSGGTASSERSSACIEEDDRGREWGGNGADAISRRHHQHPLTSTASAADDAAAASALSAALLPLFPPVSAAWAYGSGVFSQQKSDSSTLSSPLRPSVDLLFAVPDPRRWHEDNLRSNPGHYSSLARGLLGAGGISWLAESVAPGVWFNSGVRIAAAALGGGEEGGKGGEKQTTFASTVLKYGVFSEGALLSDLESWGELYLAGRLQKPTLRLSPSPPESSPSPSSSFASELEAALEANAASALAAALLLLPPTFSHSRLLSTLVSLSYSGDLRMAAAAEDPMKVEKIVRGTGRRRLDGLYSRHLCLSSPPLNSSFSSSRVASAAGLVPLCDGNAWAQDPRRESRRGLVELLPKKVRPKVVAGAAAPSSSSPSSSSSIFTSFSCSTASSSPPPPLFASSVRSALASTVRSSSARAALVGLVSAGPAGAVSRKGVFF
jgi:hypothetical protein